MLKMPIFLQISPASTFAAQRRADHLAAPLIFLLHRCCQRGRAGALSHIVRGGEK
jgi:hypothetical protein